jgi:hypothetical protein
MGQVRDLQAEYAADTAQRVTVGNTTLKQRARQFADEKRALEEKLQAARSNNRFLDKRIAQLEAELTSSPGQQEATQCPAYGPEALRSDLDRFTFLLGGSDEDDLFGPQHSHGSGSGP